MDPVDPVVAAYSDRAEEYTALLGSMDVVDPADRQTVARWAAAQTGLVVDLGCGPGHWTAALGAAGHDVVGIEPTPAFRTLARRRFPGIDVRDGRAGQLPFEDGTVGGVLAWYSLIHLDADGFGAALDEAARVVAHEGGLLLGFFEGERLETFEHQVVRARRWPVHRVSDLLDVAGFRVTEVVTRTTPPHRPHAAIGAVRVSSRG